MRKLLLENKQLLAVSLLFFSFRLFMLASLPVFNDEAIYIDWGWREIRKPGMLFYSLYDAKPPLLMWIFGIASLLFPSPLYGARFVGVLAGFLTMLGIWMIASRLFSKKTATLATLIYIAIPLFSFYDRQSLMESAISAIGVWLYYNVLLLIRTDRYRYSILTGFIMGMGMLIKPNAIIFIIPVSAMLLFHYLFSKKQSRLLVHLTAIFTTMLIVLMPLLVQPMFWQTITLNSKYIYTNQAGSSLHLYELIRKTSDTFRILLIHLTPIPLGFLLISSAISCNKRTGLRPVIIWTGLSLVPAIILSITVIERYLVSFLPLITILISYPITQIKKPIWKNLSVFSIIATAALVTFFQIALPEKYFNRLSKISPPSLSEYRSGFSSGFGVPEAVNFLKSKIGDGQAIIAMALHTGNPESGVIINFMKNKNIILSYIDAGLIDNISEYDCIFSPIPFYFVSREDDQAGLNKFLKQIYYQKNPVSGFGIGIYALKTPCHGKTFRLIGTVGK
jgi:4-amino-4-deoxy-L-arabinose transferase-like glycosyltransferase